jgi:hypothetical protein
VGLLGGARSRSLGTEGAEALPRWDPPASCPHWLSNTTCGAPSSWRARGTARMRVPSSSLTLRSGAPVRTRRGSGFEPLISRAVRGGAWAAPSLCLRSSRGLDEPALGALINNIAWHGCSWCPLRFKTGLEATFSRLYPLGGRNYLEPGARAARGYYVAWVLAMPVLFQNGPRGNLLTPVPFRGSKLSRARGSCRSRVLRGMGARDARFVSNRPRGDLLTPVPFRGLNLPRARSPCCSRVLLALQGTGPLNAPQ